MTNTLRDKQLKEQIEKIRQIKRDFNKTFNTESGKRVLANLREEFYGNHSTYYPDHDRTMVNVGLQSAFFYIQRMMDLDVEEILKKQRSLVLDPGPIIE